VTVKNSLTILFVLVSLLAPNSSQNQRPAEKPPVLTFADLQKNDSTAGPFTVVGYVIETHKCPPCPEGATCKPCLGNHVVVTDNLDQKDPALIKRLRIFTDEPDKFALHEKYSFVVKTRGRIPSGQPIRDVDLLALPKGLSDPTRQ
jgi:hypothetical protein